MSPAKKTTGKTVTAAKKAAPVKAKAKATAKKAAPVKAKAKTTAKKATPVKAKAKTTVKKAAPVKAKAKTTVKKASPVKAKAKVTAKKAAPIKAKAKTTAKKAAPVKAKAKTTAKKAAPVKAKAKTTAKKAPPVKAKAKTTIKKAVASPTTKRKLTVPPSKKKSKKKSSFTKEITEILNASRKTILLEVADKVRSESDTSKFETGDIYDIASNERERELSLILGDRDRGKLMEIDDALDRIQNDTYGECEECGEPIAEQRLFAMPFTKVCIDCKARFERDSMILGRRVEDELPVGMLDKSIIEDSEG